jgi:hypothetical protein
MADPSDVPIDLGRIVSHTIHTTGAHPFTFIASALVIAAIPYGVMHWFESVHLAQLSGDASDFFDARYWTVMGPWLLVLTAVDALLGTLLARATIDHLSGHRVDWRACALLAGRLFVPAFLISLLFGLAVLTGLLLLIVPGVMLWLAFAVAIPAYVDERTGIFGAFARSGDLTRGARWRIFLLFAAFTLADRRDYAGGCREGCQASARTGTCAARDSAGASVDGVADDGRQPLCRAACLKGGRGQRRIGVDLRLEAYLRPPRQ